MATTFGSRILQGGPTDIITANEWSQITFATSVSGITVGSGGSENGMKLPAGESLTVILEPGARIFAIGRAGDSVSFCLQPLPWLAQALLAIRNSLKR